MRGRVLNWMSKGGEGKKNQQNLDVQIIQMNPLVVKGVDSQSLPSQALESQALAKKTLAEQTLASRVAEPIIAECVLEFSPRLSAKEKEVIPVDLQDEAPLFAKRSIEESIPRCDLAPGNNEIVPGKTSNRFLALQTIEDQEVNLVVESDEDVKNVYSEENNDGQQRLASIVVEAELQNMAPSMLLGMGRFPDD
ncbi:OLC1v1008684C1 [Oldenlandia corymbosa var. corymbosa]|uniref:OLC1v1008684C1 n=1 Tax=Oldenlandia corymbosa var. corymbosa TaxID=529605 RepID=A0AAV1DQE1_OLDCO|nr:OLC1v1008684C1 [Oldenlandia corymbosa var. corymbosa]